jgi:hypothetical protein
MKRARLALSVASLFVATSVVSSNAFAFEKFTVGGGFLGAIGGQFMNKPGDRTYADGKGNRVPDPSYPGFGGFNGPMPGFFIEGRFLGIVGLEIDFIRQDDRAHGDITSNGRTVTVDVGQKAWHIPVLIKGTLPSPLFSPSVFIGPEFVSPDAGTVVLTPAGSQTSPPASAKADSYTMLTMGLGGEFKLPIPSVDIRIPFSLRGSIQPGFSDTLDDREKPPSTATGGTVQYNTAWRYQALATLGAAVHF